jgi:hypothetical protein
LLVDDGLGNAVLFSIGAASARGSRVLYFAGYKLMQDRYKVEEFKRADCVVWCRNDFKNLGGHPALPSVTPRSESFRFAYYCDPSPITGRESAPASTRVVTGATSGSDTEYIRDLGAEPA